MTSVWQKLEDLDVRSLAYFLRNEYPQTVAFILTRLNAKVSAMVVVELPESFAMEVVMRIGRMEAVSHTVSAIVERTIQKTLDEKDQNVYTNTVEYLGEMFSHFNPENQQRFLDVTKERNQHLAGLVMESMRNVNGK